MTYQVTFSPGAETEPRLLAEKTELFPANRPGFAANDLLPKMLDDLVLGFSEQVAIVDENWIIVSVNQAWKQMVKVAGYADLVTGVDYRDFLETFARKGHENARTVLAGVSAIERGETDSFDFSYAGTGEWEGRTLQLRVHRLRIQGHLVATIARQDVTDSVQLRRVRQDCTAAILNSETEARQRLTRELHDSTAQLLTAIGLLLSTLKHRTRTSGTVGVMDEIQGLLRQATEEIRSMSYLAQAPDLSQSDIVQSLDALAAGFGRRAQLDISFQVRGRRRLLTPSKKTAVYRVAQEALSNVYRHAHAEQVKISLVFRRSAFHLVVADDGIGIPDEMLAGTQRAGVGIGSMRSRLIEIGGRLSVRRLRPGSAIIASIPAC